MELLLRLFLSLFLVDMIILKYPSSFCNWVCLLQTIVRGTKEIVLAAKETEKFLIQMLKKYVPNKILQSTVVEMDNYPLLAGKIVRERCSYYLCEDYKCSREVNSLEDFVILLDYLL